MSSETEHLLRIIGDTSSARQSIEELAAANAEAADRVVLVEEALKKFEAAVDKAVRGTERLTAAEKALVENAAGIGPALDAAAVEAERQAERTQRALTSAAQQRLREIERTADAEERTAKRVADTQIREAQRAEREQTNSLRRMAQLGAQGLGLGGVSSALAGGLGGGLAAFAAGSAIRQSIEDMLKYSDAVKLVTQTTGESARESSTMLAVAQRLGVEYEKVAQALIHVNQVTISSPQQFAALGIALEDNTGKARSSLDILMELRSVFSELPNDAARSALAAEMFGSAWRDILPWLTATDEEIKRLQASVQESALVMDEEGIKKADEWKKQLALLGTEVQSLSLTIAQWLVPQLLILGETTRNEVRGIQQMFEAIGMGLRYGAAAAAATVQNARRATQESRTEGTRLTRDIGGVDETSPDAASALRRNLAEEASLRRSQSAEVIDILRDQQRARNEAAREELDTLRRNTGYSIEAIEDERRARNEMYREQLEGIRDASEAVLDGLSARREAIQAEQEAFETSMRAQQDALEGQRRTAQDVYDATREQRQASIDAIQEESDALTEQFRLRQSTRSAAIESLRDQMRATEDLFRIERMRKDLADAEHDLLVQQSIQVFRRRNETEEQYQERVFERNRRVREAEEQVQEQREDIERETSKRVMEERIRAIEEMSRADERAHTAAIRRNNDRVDAIRETMETEARAHRDFMRAIESRGEAIRREVTANAESTRRRLTEIGNLEKAERERTRETIEGIQRQQQRQNEADSERIRGLQRMMAQAALESAERIKQDEIATKAVIDNVTATQKAVEAGAAAKSLAEQQAAKAAGDAWVEAYNRARAAAGLAPLSGGGGGGAGPVGGANPGIGGRTSTGGGRNETRVDMPGGGGGIPQPVAVGFPNPYPPGSPDYYAAIARQYAVEAGIDPVIFANQMYHESGMNPNARGAAGEVGIAQFMPGTAPSWGVTDRSDPFQSLRGAAAYMRTALVQSGGDYSKALAMYNGGFGYMGSPGQRQAEGYAQHVLNMNVYGLTAEEAAAIVAARVGREMDAQAAGGAMVI